MRNFHSLHPVVHQWFKSILLTVTHCSLRRSCSTLGITLSALVFAGIAAFADLFDLCVCNFAGSFLISGLLFVIACGLQAATFTLLADPAFWYVSIHLIMDRVVLAASSSLACVLKRYLIYCFFSLFIKLRRRGASL
jgi:hypothetical protein